MGRSQVMYNRTKARGRGGRGNSSIVSELTDGSSAHFPPLHRQQYSTRRVPSFASERSTWSEPDHFAESDPSVSITESMQQQLQVDETVDRLLLEMPSATSAYAQSFAGRSSARSHLGSFSQDLLRFDTSASVTSSLDDSLTVNTSMYKDMLQVEVINACLQQELSLAQQLSIPQHLIDAIHPGTEDSESIQTPSDDTQSLKSLFNDKLQRAMTGDERIMAARSPSPSPTRTMEHARKLDTITGVASPKNTALTPRSLMAAPSDENSILAENDVMNDLRDSSSSSSSSDEDNKADLILASRQSSDDEEDVTTMHLLGSVTTKQNSLSTNATSTLAGERILDESTIQRSLLAPVPIKPQPMATTNEKRPIQSPAKVISTSTTAVEGILNLRRSLSPPRDARLNIAHPSPQTSSPILGGKGLAREAPGTNAAPSPNTWRLRTPLRIDIDPLPQDVEKNDLNIPQFLNEDMTAISSIGIVSIRDDPRLVSSPPPPPPTDSGWAPKPGESFAIKSQVPGTSPRTTAHKVLSNAPASTPIVSNKVSPKTKAENMRPISVSSPLSKRSGSKPSSEPQSTGRSETPRSAPSKSPPSPRPKVEPKAAISDAVPALSPKHKKLLNRIRTLSPHARNKTSSDDGKKMETGRAHSGKPIQSTAQESSKISSNVSKSSKSPTRAQLYPIHDLSVTAPHSSRQNSPGKDIMRGVVERLENKDVPQGSLGISSAGAPRRGRSPVRRNELARQKLSASRGTVVPGGMHDDGGQSVGADNTSANTSTMLSSIHLLEDCDTVPGIEVTDRRAKAVKTSGGGTFSYQGSNTIVDLQPAKSRASDIATYVEDASNQGLEIKRSPIRLQITTKEVATSPVRGQRSKDSPQRKMVDVIDLSAVDSASLSPSRIIKAIRTGQPLIRDKSSSPSKRRETVRPPSPKAQTSAGNKPMNRSSSREQRTHRSKSPRQKSGRAKDKWKMSIESPASATHDEGIEVAEIDALNDWLDSVIS